MGIGAGADRSIFCAFPFDKLDRFQLPAARRLATKKMKEQKDMQPDYFDLLDKSLDDVKLLQTQTGVIRYFADEVMRFRSIAGTLRAVGGFTLDETASADERSITHVLMRSLLEGYFNILYLFDDVTQASARYLGLTNAFKHEYIKLMNEGAGSTLAPVLQANPNPLEPANPLWVTTPRIPDARSILEAITNQYGDRLGFLYFTYRVSSFDTHGRGHKGLYEDVFNKAGNFPVLKIKNAIDIVANEYLVVLNLIQGGTVV